MQLGGNGSLARRFCQRDGARLPQHGRVAVLSVDWRTSEPPLFPTGRSIAPRPSSGTVVGSGFIFVSAVARCHLNLRPAPARTRAS